MFRIGIIGTENSHAMAFAKEINLPDPQTGKLRYEDARVVGVYGPDPDSTKAIMETVGVDFIASSVDEFFGKVDAMMVTSRKGSLHYGYIKPFIEKGMPVFIDKPITSDSKEALELVKLAKEKNSPVTGGSGCKYAYDILTMKDNARAMLDAKTFRSGAINFAIQVDSIYDGIFFYGSHLAEMALTVFGYDMRSVIACEKNGNILVTARYDDFDISLHYLANASATSCLIFGDTKNVYREIDISRIYSHEVEKFIAMLRTNQMSMTFDEIIKPVFVLEAIKESMETGKEVKIGL